MVYQTESAAKKPSGRAIKLKRTLLKAIRCWQLYVLLLIPVVYTVIFAYVPMYGAQIAFRNFRPVAGIWGSEFVGLEHFIKFAKSVSFWQLIRNTIVISVYDLVLSLPFSMLFALGLNYIRQKGYKKTIQLISYAPHFISTVVMCGIIVQFVNPRIGIINKLFEAVGMAKVDFLASPNAFPSLYVWTNLWQSLGFSSIIFIAVLSSVNPELHEAAIVDGATITKRIIFIDLPAIMPTAITLLILNSGKILSLGFEKVLLLQTPLNQRTSEVISTYIYKIGIAANFPNFSYSTAVGLFQSIIGLLLMIGVNTVSRKVSETSLW
ncbi:MAG: ABC transporter permease [Christensenellales bacterium]